MNLSSEIIHLMMQRDKSFNLIFYNLSQFFLNRLLKLNLKIKIIKLKKKVYFITS